MLLGIGLHLCDIERHGWWSTGRTPCMTDIKCISDHPRAARSFLYVPRAFQVTCTFPWKCHRQHILAPITPLWKWIIRECFWEECLWILALKGEDKLSLGAAYNWLILSPVIPLSHSQSSCLSCGLAWSLSHSSSELPPLGFSSSISLVANNQWAVGMYIHLPNPALHTSFRTQYIAQSYRVKCLWEYLDALLSNEILTQELLSEPLYSTMVITRVPMTLALVTGRNRKSLNRTTHLRDNEHNYSGGKSSYPFRN